jgi:hypothetical protein
MRDRKQKTRSYKRLLPIALALGALLLTPAMAGHRDHRQHRHHDRGHQRPHHVRLKHGHHKFRHHPSAHFHRRFVAPPTIRSAHFKTYRPYYHGRMYYRPHRHEHAVYYFPVRTRVGYAWRPHSYCNGKLYRAHLSYHGPQISFSLSF